MGKNKNVFLEALLLTLLVFLIGILLGVLFEENRANDVGDYYAQSEVSLMDILAFNNFVNLNTSECNSLIYYNINFANKIYGEAKILENYEDVGKITDRMTVQHTKYDVMRTLLWINTIKTDRMCNNNIHTIVYLYEYDPTDLTEKAVNNVWSNVLSELKAVQGDNLILIPIAVNSNIVALNAIIESYDIEQYPAIIIDNDKVVNNVSSVEELETYLI